MTTEQTLLIELETDGHPEEIEIEVEVEYDIENDGIGPYEFWGQKCVDKGTDTVVITDVHWDKTGFTEEEINLIESAIEKNKEHWEESIESDCGWD